jgi:hypothetical protein
VTGCLIFCSYINNSSLGAKEFRDVLRFLAIDEPPLLPRSSSTANGSTTELCGGAASMATPPSKKRKFVEVPDSADATDVFGQDLDHVGKFS